MYSFAFPTFLRKRSFAWLGLEFLLRQLVGERHRLVFARLLEHCHDPLHLIGRRLVHLRRRAAGADDAVDDNRQRLRHPVEHQQLVGDDETNRRHAKLVLWRARHNRLDVMDELVADKAKRTAGESRQTIDIHRLVVGQNFLDDLEPVADLAFRLGPATTDNLVRLPHLAALDPLHRVADLADHPARVATHERVAAEVLPSLDRLKKKRLPLAADFAISRQREFPWSANSLRVTGIRFPCSAKRQNSSLVGRQNSMRRTV